MVSDNKTSISSLMSAKQDVLKAHLNLVLNHPTTQGDNCEGAWIDFFRSFLPSKYAVDKRFVFDSDGNISDQIDIIIYDALYAPLIFGTEAGEKYVTAESVYAVFDSKPKIDLSTLRYTNSKVESVTRLHRGRREVINAGKKCEPRNLTEILGGILASKAIKPEMVEQYCRDLPHIDFGCAVNNYSFIVRRDAEGSEFQHSEVSDAILAFFFIILDELYKQGTVAGLDIRDYSDAALTSIKLRR